MFDPTHTKLNHSQKVFTAVQWRQLLQNSKTRPEGAKPVVKLFNPMGAATWLLTECDEDGIAFGLCDLGMGFPELGYVCIPEIVELFTNSRGRRWIERDLHFKASKTLAEYADEAREKQRIIA